jgi:hypothetical protein
MEWRAGWKLGEVAGSEIPVFDSEVAAGSRLLKQVILDNKVVPRRSCHSQSVHVISIDVVDEVLTQHCANKVACYSDTSSMPAIRAAGRTPRQSINGSLILRRRHPLNFPRFQRLHLVRRKIEYFLLRRIIALSIYHFSQLHPLRHITTMAP